MYSSQATCKTIASVFAAATLALALVPSALAADFAYGSRHASASPACERARQFAIFKRQMERTDGDASPALPAGVPAECRMTQAANGADAVRLGASEPKDVVAPARKGYGDAAGDR